MKNVIKTLALITIGVVIGRVSKYFIQIEFEEID